MIKNNKSIAIKIAAVAFLCLNTTSSIMALDVENSRNQKQYMQLIWEGLLFDSSIENVKTRTPGFWKRYEKRVSHQDSSIKNYIIENKQQAGHSVCRYLNNTLNQENGSDRDECMDDIFKLLKVLETYLSKEDFESLERRIEEIFEVVRQSN